MNEKQSSYFKRIFRDLMDVDTVVRVDRASSRHGWFKLATPCTPRGEAFLENLKAYLATQHAETKLHRVGAEYELHMPSAPVRILEDMTSMMEDMKSIDPSFIFRFSYKDANGTRGEMRSTLSATRQKPKDLSGGFHPNA